MSHYHERHVQTVESLLALTLPGGPKGDCAIWQGKTTASARGEAYGACAHNGRWWKAHRLMWTLAEGGIPAGMHALHSCDTPLCISRSHLWLGTHLQNMQDMAAKGRGKFSEARKRKISVALTGKQNALGAVRSAETRQKMADAQRGNKHCLGKTHSAETRRKMSDAKRAGLVQRAIDMRKWVFGSSDRVGSSIKIVGNTVEDAGLVLGA
jgi:hypothetical protein